MPHGYDPYAALKRAYYTEGKQIQSEHLAHGRRVWVWLDCEPCWNLPAYRYRIKPDFVHVAGVPGAIYVLPEKQVTGTITGVLSGEEE